MATLTSLAEKLERKIKVAEKQSNLVAITVGKAVLRDLVSVTPVDTSLALSNWQVGLGAPVTSRVSAFAFGRKGSTANTSRPAAIQKGEAVLNSKKPGQTIYISNLTQYIGDLDKGSSKQFAGNFILRARQVARVAVGKL